MSPVWVQLQLTWPAGQPGQLSSKAGSQNPEVDYAPWLLLLLCIPDRS